MNNYEGLFIVKPELKDEEAKGVYKVITEAMAKNGGTITKEEAWGKRQLGFPVKKSKDGYYYKVEFSAPAEAIVKLEGIFKLNADILRVMMTRK